MTVDEQLTEWLKGNPIHNAGRDECCPDFSCCDVSLLASEEERQTFVDANGETRHMMLMGFLSAMMIKEGKNVYIAGDPANYQRDQ